MPEIPNDTYDPCAAFIELREAHRKALTGETVRSVRFRNGEEEHQTDFGPTNIAALERAMAQAKDECLIAQGGRPRRSAIGIGFRGPIITKPY